MAVNNVIWVRRTNFVAKWHCLHYFIAAALLVLYLPHKSWWPAMTNLKYLCTAGNILIFQMLLGRVASLTETHHLVIFLITLVNLMVETVNWFSVELASLGVWDCCLHGIAPVILMLLLSIVTIKDRLGKDLIMIDEFEAIKKVLGSISQGVALTVDFPS